MRTLLVLACGAGLALLTPSMGIAQEPRDAAGWDWGLDVLYQTSADADFNGGTSLHIKDGFGLGISFGRRFNPKFDLQFALEIKELQYGGVLVSTQVPGLSADAHGKMEVVTPRLNVVYNFRTAALTPYVSAGAGWSFIDTNLPAVGQEALGCWWDPWGGPTCQPDFRRSRRQDAFTYQAGVGLRWVLSESYALRASYEKVWLDLDEATSALDQDLLKVGFALRF